MISQTDSFIMTSMNFFKFLRLILSLFFILAFIGCSNKDSKPITVENAKKGELLFNSTGCTKCHSVSSESKYGPPLNFTLGDNILIIRKGKIISVTLDRRYIIKSITYPESEKLFNYQDKKMPVVSLPHEDIERLADYLIYINTKGKPN
jgi:hypothetical protein